MKISQLSPVHLNQGRVHYWHRVDLSQNQNILGVLIFCDTLCKKKKKILIFFCEPQNSYVTRIKYSWFCTNLNPYICLYNYFIIKC